MARLCRKADLSESLKSTNCCDATFHTDFPRLSDLIFDVAELVSWCSQGTTLPPGTLM